MKHKLILFFLIAMMALMPITALADGEKVYTPEELNEGYLWLREHGDQWGVRTFALSFRNNELIIYEEDKIFTEEEREEIRRGSGIDHITFRYIGIPVQGYELVILFQLKIFGYHGFQEATSATMNNIEAYDLKRGAPLLDENGVTQIPLQLIQNAFGGSILWDAVENKATLSNDKVTMEVYPEANYILVNGVRQEVAVLCYKDRLYLPIRTVAGVMGAEIVWHGTSAEVWMSWT